MKKTLKILGSLILIFIIMMFTNKIFAASASISAGSTSITKGNSTSISVSVSNTEAWNLKITASDGNLSGTTESIDAPGSEVSQGVINATFQADTAGTYTIYLTGQITGSDLQRNNINKSVTITVTEPATSNNGGNTSNTSSSSGSSSSGSSSSSSSSSSGSSSTTTTRKSSDATLKSIIIDGFLLSPEFDTNIKEYTLEVPNETTTLNISTITNDVKATANVEKPEELQIGENTININVTAENGTTTSKYTITVTRKRAELALQSMAISILDENGVKKNLKITPEFAFDTYEYELEDIDYSIDELLIEAIANQEGTTVEIVGNTDLKEGKNTIEITVKLTAEDGTEEIKTYTITVNKEQAPVEVPLTMGQKIGKFFTGLGIGKWWSENLRQIIFGSITFCAVATAGLTVYFIVDFKKYKELMRKLKELNKLDITYEPQTEEQTKQPEETVGKSGGKHF